MKQLKSNTNTSPEDVSFSIPTYVINLRKREDRKIHVLEQFDGRDEFQLNIIEAFEHSNGALGLWMTIRHILNDLTPSEAEYVIICEDDVEFTEDYSKENLFQAIYDARNRSADVLLGGVSWFDDTVQVTDNLFWTNRFTGLQFTVIFKEYRSKLSTLKLQYYSAADHFIARFSENVMFRHPFLAIQKEFGYSDATEQNNEKGRVESYFKYTDGRMSFLNKVKSLYRSLPKEKEIGLDPNFYNTIVISTYIINLPERTERLEHIIDEFKDKPEFDIQIVQACKHEVGALGLWLSIRKIIEMAIANEDDVIIICEDDHQFTEHYSKEYLIKNIIEANEDGACLLSGGTGQFNNAVPLTSNRYWVKHCLSTQFMVIYKDFFQQILDQQYDEAIVADLAYSKMTGYKMVLYPFISTQKDFGYSDITAIHSDVKDLVTKMFKNSHYKLKRIQEAYIKYSVNDNDISIEKSA